MEGAVRIPNVERKRIERNYARSGMHEYAHDERQYTHRSRASHQSAEKQKTQALFVSTKSLYRKCSTCKYGGYNVIALVNMIDTEAKIRARGKSV